MDHALTHIDHIPHFISSANPIQFYPRRSGYYRPMLAAVSVAMGINGFARMHPDLFDAIRRIIHQKFIVTPCPVYQTVAFHECTHLGIFLNNAL